MTDFAAALEAAIAEHRRLLPDPPPEHDPFDVDPAWGEPAIDVTGLRGDARRRRLHRDEWLATRRAPRQHDDKEVA